MRTGQDGALVIDLQAFNQFSWSRDDTQVTVGTGIRLGNLYVELAEKGRALPAGSVNLPSVVPARRS